MKSIVIVWAVAASFGFLCNAAPLENRGIKSCYSGGKASFTQYWVPKEGTKDMLNDGSIVTLTGSKSKSLKTPSGKVLAKVSKVTYEKCQMEGTCLLSDGELINLDSGQNTFQKVNTKQHPYGLGNSDTVSLQPWTSVAANDLKKGTTLYVKAIDGLKLPNGMTHNGCVKVDDQSWSFGSCHLDWFVLMYETYAEIANQVGEHIKAEQKSCKILNYVNSSTKKWLAGSGNIKSSGSSSSSSSSGKSSSSKSSSSGKGSSHSSSSSKKSKSKKKSSSTKKSTHHKSKHHKSKHHKRSIGSVELNGGKTTTLKSHHKKMSKTGQKSSDNKQPDTHDQKGGSPLKHHSNGTNQTNTDHCYAKKGGASSENSSKDVNLTTVANSRRNEGGDSSVHNSNGSPSSNDTPHKKDCGSGSKTGDSSDSQ